MLKPRKTHFLTHVLPLGTLIWFKYKGFTGKEDTKEIEILHEDLAGRTGFLICANSIGS